MTTKEVVYHVFDPLTGQYTNVLSLEEAASVRKNIIEKFMKANASIFSILEEVQKDGKSTARMVNIETELSNQQFNIN